MSEKTNSDGIGCFTVLGIVFITLKLLGISPVANWRWIWVLAPFWIPLAIVCFILALVTVVVAICNTGNDKGSNI